MGLAWRPGYEVISADTNYASAQGEDLRGGSWCEVQLTFENGRSQARLRGARPDQLGHYDFKLQELGTEEGVAYVGMA